MSDLVERLRKKAWRGPAMEAAHTKTLEWKAADRIEQLEGIMIYVLGTIGADHPAKKVIRVALGERQNGTGRQGWDIIAAAIGPDSPDMVIVPREPTQDDLTLVYMWAYKMAEKKYKSRIGQLEAALRRIADENNYGSDGCWVADSYPDEIARAALGEKKDA